MNKEETYQEILPQIKAIVGGETDLIANMANVAAVLHDAFHFWWTGFYLVKEKDTSLMTEKDTSLTTEKDTGQSTKKDTSLTVNEEQTTTKELVLGPFQGPIACTRIPFNKGVCGTAWAQGKTLIVPNVHEFKGHIACSSASKSEIVVPIRRHNDPNGEIIAVLDIDSAEYNTFDAIDQIYLEQISLD